MPSSVAEIAPADSAAALAHFESAFRFETDCWDVHDAMSNGRQDFVLVDVRSPISTPTAMCPARSTFRIAS